MPGRRLLPLLLAAGLLLALPGCGGRLQGGGPIRVAVSIPPLADMVREIGGDRVTLELLVPPGASEHTYEPAPRQVQFVTTAQLLVLNGVNLEYWAPNVIDAANNPKLRVVYTANGLPILGQANEAGGDPHVWLNPQYAIHQAEAIRDALIAVDPQYADTYRKNANDYVGKLQALDAEIQAKTASWTHRSFVAFHSAWAYFAQRYDLVQAAAIEEFPGKEPSPQYLAEVVQTVKQTGARAVFAEPQLSPKAAETVATEAGVKVVILDPLGGVVGRQTYVELMRYNVDHMAEALH